MRRFSSVALGVGLVLAVACGGGGGGGGGSDAAAAGAGGATSTGGAGGTMAGSGGATAGSGGSSAGGAPAGGAAGAGTGGAAGAGAAIPMGDHFCMVKRMEAVQWTFGYDSRCVITESPMGGPLPPATVAMMLNNACAYVHGGTPATSCPRENMIAYCPGGFAPAGAKSTTILVYASKFTPDAEHVALNAIASCSGAEVRDPAGQVVARKCKGTVTAKIDGQMVSFSKNLGCWYKSDGSKRHYLIDASSEANANLKLAFVSQGGVHGYDTDPLGFMGAGYTEGVTVFALSSNPAGRTVNATKFAERGTGLNATFSVGELRAGSNTVRSITEGTIDIELAAP